VPEIILTVRGSFNTSADASITAMNERVIATGYAVLRSIRDNTYSQIKNPVTYKRMPKIN